MKNVMNSEFDIFTDSGKYNQRIIYREGDSSAKTKILSKEPYAQELYDKYMDYFLDNENVNDNVYNKDLTLNTHYQVIPVTVNYNDKLVKTEIVGTGIPVFIPFSELLVDLSELNNEMILDIIVYNNYRGVFYGSHKKFAKKGYLKEVVDAYNNNTWFDVKVLELIEGGYIVMYKNTVKCFLPGGQAVANIIRDFEDLIGKTIPVMVDNYDPNSQLYIVSYKKYIKKTLFSKIKELEFGKPYKGMLTSNPTPFGLFIEIENFFTGLLHPSEVSNYNDLKNKLKAFDEIEVYIKDIIYDTNKKRYRILFTDSVSKVNNNKLLYSIMKKSYTNVILNYDYSEENSTISIYNDEKGIIEFPVIWSFVSKYINKGYKHVVVKDVDVIKERVYFDFVK